MNELFMNCRNSPDLSSRMRHQDSNFQIFQDAPGLSGTPDSGKPAVMALEKRTYRDMTHEKKTSEK